MKKFVKKKLSTLERLRWLKSAVEWLSQTYLPCYDHDRLEWTIEPFPLTERFECFLSCLETAILGYVYVTEASLS